MHDEISAYNIGNGRHVKKQLESRVVESYEAISIRCNCQLYQQFWVFQLQEKFQKCDPRIVEAVFRNFWIIIIKSRSFGCAYPHIWQDFSLRTVALYSDIVREDRLGQRPKLHFRVGGFRRTCDFSSYLWGPVHRDLSSFRPPPYPSERRLWRGETKKNLEEAKRLEKHANTDVSAAEEALGGGKLDASEIAAGIRRKGTVVTVWKKWENVNHFRKFRAMEVRIIARKRMLWTRSFSKERVSSPVRERINWTLPFWNIDLFSSLTKPVLSGFIDLDAKIGWRACLVFLHYSRKRFVRDVGEKGILLHKNTGEAIVWTEQFPSFRHFLFGLLSERKRKEGRGFVI
ncbi:hypothetical protein HNY73_017859 [Argiope bruennichi]|uniref:Uncharacterized protein n=1 Tax=Argiope bruennichi TaxID=94029 RepID=A0A8T0ECG0_ARGBR|nr:hypothetical protein HNY73_017859 [Argiope bruennichi]